MLRFPKQIPTPGAVCGLDYAGVIVRMDDEVVRLRPDLKIGDRVCGLVHGSNPTDKGNGSFAEYICALVQLVINVPEALSLNQALALGECLDIPGSLSSPTPQPFDALVCGGSTCCGTMAIQLLKLSGARVIATCSPRSFDLVKKYGADLAFDYAEAGATEAVTALTKCRLRYALDCIANEDSASFCYTSLGRSGARYTSLELCPSSFRRRKVVNYDCVIALEIFGKDVKMGSDYSRAASPVKHDIAVRCFQMFQKLLEDGLIRPHPIRVLHSLGSICEGLDLLRTGSVSRLKLYVFKIINKVPY
ncbi:hypothetical protein B0I35DRAFT_454459 [Stachybotrys elegans]|uniref:Alcohol dehydrogenase-like C-terminal domain-containing protein n=1 Tax=Stachybotrys elegans TaxID=80388 RepID=A0A8K0WLE6_9HYPO|nr:hypothetical protein B0I35DRAFT_454459 [Stachybotrys elegans]